MDLDGEGIAPGQLSDTEFREAVAKLIDLGVVEVHPGDVDLPWEQWRLRRTGLGHLVAPLIEPCQN